MEEMKSKYECFISTDGKNTIHFNAEHSKELLNTLKDPELQEAWQMVRSMAEEVKYNTQKVVQQANGEGAGKCPIHQVTMEWGVSKTKIDPKTGKPASYKYHDDEFEGRCFGRGYQKKT